MKYWAVVVGTLQDAWARKAALVLSGLAVVFLLVYAFGLEVSPSNDPAQVYVSLFGTPVTPGSAPSQAPLEDRGEPVLRSLVVYGSGAFALGLLNPFGILFALFIVISLWNTAFQPQQLYWMLSKPLSRWGLLLSKYGGALLLVALTSMGFILLMAGLIYWKTQAFSGGLLLVGLIAVFNYACLAALALLIVTWTNNTGLGLMLTLLAYFLIQFLQVMPSYSLYGELPAWIRGSLDALYHILPKLSDLELISHSLLENTAVSGVSLALRSSLAAALSSSTAFLLAALGLSVWQFQRKDF